VTIGADSVLSRPFKRISRRF